MNDYLIDIKNLAKQKFNISLYKGDRITIDSCPDWMWWDVAEVYDPIEEAEMVTNLKPGNPSEEDIGPYWIPM